MFVVVAAGSDTVNGDTKATQPPVQLSLHVDGSAQPTDVVARTVVVLVAGMELMIMMPRM